MSASDATRTLPAKGRARRLGREILLHLAILAAVLGLVEFILRAVDLRELRDSYEPGRTVLGTVVLRPARESLQQGGGTAGEVGVADGTSSTDKIVK